MEIPMSFQPEMISTIRAGMKTCTRRCVDTCRPGDIIVTNPGGLRLRVTSVTGERLQDISTEDCLAEGITFDGKDFFPAWEGAPKGVVPYEHFAWSAFRKVWSKCYGETGQFSWDANPLVYVVRFEIEGVAARPNYAAAAAAQLPLFGGR